MSCPGLYVMIDDPRLWVIERGDGFPVVVLHGGPGLDHHMFGDYLDPLTDRYRLIAAALRGLELRRDRGRGPAG